MSFLNNALRRPCRSTLPTLIEYPTCRVSTSERLDLHLVDFHSLKPVIASRNATSSLWAKMNSVARKLRGVKGQAKMTKIVRIRVGPDY